MELQERGASNQVRKEKGGWGNRINGERRGIHKEIDDYGVEKRNPFRGEA